MIDFAKVNAALDDMVKSTKDPEVLRGLQGVKDEVRQLGEEAEKLSEANKKLDEDNRKLVEGLKKAVLTAGSGLKDGEANPGDPAPKAKTFEEILAEKAAEYKAEQNKK